jgi:hypothetical protein
MRLEFRSVRQPRDEGFYFHVMDVWLEALTRETEFSQRLNENCIDSQDISYGCCFFVPFVLIVLYDFGQGEFSALVHLRGGIQSGPGTVSFASNWDPSGKKNLIGL